MRRLIWIVFGLLVIYLLLGHLTNLRSYRSLPDRELEGQLLSVTVDIGELRKAGESDSQKRELFRLRAEKTKILAEMQIRRYHLDEFAMFLFIFSLIGLVAMRLKRKAGELPTSTDAVIRDMNVHVDSPKEEYIDEWELQNRVQSGFKTKDAAIRWLKSDPMLVCDYCGSQLRSTFTGEREAIQLVTFYKKVPAGAQDLRVVLGNYWFPRHATELRCGKCGKTVTR